MELGQDEYLGTGQGLHGEIVAKVKVEDGKVVAVDVVKQTETPDITEKVWTDMPAAMVASGGSEVDTVTGATIASEGLIAAVEDALGQAR
ncbi:FMN-binding protein [Eggerthella sinensis]|nr:FMN-binding protein [Eggerthella sinensis]MCB7039007.1 FMN-binding protein [Eggerthella sinensis]